MQVTASAPGKAILFGEHAVVYGKPAIAVAIDKRARVKISKRADSQIHVSINGLGVSGYLELENNLIKLRDNQGNTGILNYIMQSIKKVDQVVGYDNKLKDGLEITVDLDIPIGAGLGSSAAVTVATIAAALTYCKLEHNQDESSVLELEQDQIASFAHEVELEVQGAASRIDTALSTCGGAIYLSRDADNIVHLPLNWDIPLIIGYRGRESNTGKLVESVRIKKEKYPSVVDPIMDSMEQITEKARLALMDRDEEVLGELMNINQGLLDALGVNTAELSRMVFCARKAGAYGSKITGAGGGGSIIAYCPQKMDEVLTELQRLENAFPIQLSEEGVRVNLSKTVVV